MSVSKRKINKISNQELKALHEGGDVDGDSVDAGVD